MKITVTRKDIQEGCKQSSHNCPIARAVIRAIGALPEGVSIGTWDWAVAGYGRNKQPRSASRFIEKFDKTGKGKPFSFFLRPMIGT